jgi:hypothetical protein
MNYLRKFNERFKIDNVSWDIDSIKLEYLDMLYKICRYFHGNFLDILDDSKFDAIRIVFGPGNLSDSISIDTIYGVVDFDDDDIFGGELKVIDLGDLGDLDISSILDKDIPFFSPIDCLVNIIVIDDDCYFCAFDSDDGDYVNFTVPDIRCW